MHTYQLLIARLEPCKTKQCAHLPAAPAVDSCSFPSGSGHSTRAHGARVPGSPPQCHAQHKEYKNTRRCIVTGRLASATCSCAPHLQVVSHSLIPLPPPARGCVSGGRLCALHKLLASARRAEAPLESGKHYMSSALCSVGDRKNSIKLPNQKYHQCNAHKLMK